MLISTALLLILRSPNTFAKPNRHYQLRKLLANIIIWLVALSILNSSIGIPDIDSRDFGNTPMQALSNWNEFESIYEWVAEEALNLKNAVPEEQNRQGNEHIIVKKHVPDYLPIQFEKNRISCKQIISICTTISANYLFKPLAGYITLFSPPPDVA